MPAIAPPALSIFQKAQNVWENRRLPPYVEFDVQIRHVDSAGGVTTGTEHVLLRTLDHWCRTREIDSNSVTPQTSIGPPCVGPGLSPLGFNVAAQYPTSKQIDPFTPGAQTIASVRAIHYQVTFEGENTIDNRPCYHLSLQPIGDPNYYPLRSVWIDETTYDVRRLTYIMRQNGWSGAIDYSFRPYQDATWWISAIDANWTPPARDRTDLPFRSTLLLTNVTFPAASEP